MKRMIAVLLVLSFVWGGLGLPRSRSYKLRNTCNCECGVTNRRVKVVGGNITRIHEFPWLAGLSYKGEFICGASLISKRHVITAAHCVERYAVDELTVVLGDHDRDSAHRDSEIVVRRLKDFRMHEDFNSYTFNNDIAILELDRPVQFDSYIQPACLPTKGNSDYSGQYAVVAGWGRTAANADTSRILRKVVVPVWTREECLNSGYSAKRLSENMFCAGYPEGGKDACQGDSGGPLQFKGENGNMEIIGLVSWGRGCAKPNLPGVYTKVTNYLDWVDETLNGECVCTGRGA